MAAAADGGGNNVGLEALHRLNSTEAPLYLTKSDELKEAARLASKYLFSSLSPYAPKSPFSELLSGEDFDAEQIWQQIDLQAQPLLSSLRRHVRNLEKNPEEIRRQFNLERVSGVEKNGLGDGENKGNDGAESLSDDLDDVDDNNEEDEEEEDEEEGEEHDDEDGEEEENVNGVEDKFLKIKELEEYLKEDEAKEYGLKKDNKNKRKRGKTVHEDDEDEDGNEDDEDGEEEDDEIALMGLDDDDDAENARYEDFFGVRKIRQRKYNQYRRPDKLDRHETDNNNNKVIRDPDIDEDEDENEGNDDDDDDDNENRVINEPESNDDNQKKQIVSTHEKELEKKRAEIEEMEKANLEPKTWTMQGEITAAKRPKNSALEVDLDFEHNVRPAPETTEEAHVSLEELIKKRILEGRFDDVQKPPTLSTKAPREKKELDENKSKKGLAELYEDEYAEKTGLVSTALTFSDEQKKEASTLFKKLCVKLDALCHFHFTPKPVIEDMSIQANVPALAMEEIAPLAVSDAAMLAPEEVFYGKGDIKEETELTKSDRKRRRAKKKRKFKAESAKTLIIRPQLTSSTNPGNGKEGK